MTTRRERTFCSGSGREPRRRARVACWQLLLAVAALIAFGGCSGMKQTFDGWFGEEPASPAAQEGQTYYAAVEGLALYAEASSSSKVVGRLAQYERVTRTRMERGYALVRSDKSGVEGWVNNALLVWRIPTSTESQAREKAPAKAAPAAGGAAGADATGAPDSTGATAAEPTPTKTPAGAAPAAEEAPAQASPPASPTVSQPSMFDPF